MRDDYTGEIDYFAVFAPPLEETYLVAIEEAAKGKMELRFEEPGNNQWAGVNWHEDFKLDTVLEKGLA